MILHHELSKELWKLHIYAELGINGLRTPSFIARRHMYLILPCKIYIESGMLHIIDINVTQ